MRLERERYTVMLHVQSGHERCAAAPIDSKISLATALVALRGNVNSIPHVPGAGWQPQEATCVLLCPGTNDMLMKFKPTSSIIYPRTPR